MSVKFQSEYKSFDTRKLIRKYLRQSGSHLDLNVLKLGIADLLAFDINY